MKFQDLTDQKIHLLTFRKFSGRNDRGQALWVVDCDCGTKGKVVAAHHVKRGNIQSCGCLNKGEARSKASTRHGMSFTSEWNSYHASKKRCNPKYTEKYPRHAGRGIAFRFNNFDEFYAELGPKPEPKFDYTCDRIDNDGHYEPGNVRWATKEQQAGNRRCDNCEALKARIAELEASLVNLTSAAQ
jgi:hypothetical protein